MVPDPNADPVREYAKIRTRLMWASFVGAAIAVLLHFVFGKTKWQRSPLVAVDGVSPLVFSWVAVVLLAGLIAYIIFYWRCPACRSKFFWTVRANRYQYTFDLKTCPKCQVSLKEE